MYSNPYYPDPVPPWWADLLGILFFLGILTVVAYGYTTLDPIPERAPLRDIERADRLISAFWASLAVIAGGSSIGLLCVSAVYYFIGFMLGDYDQSDPSLHKPQGIIAYFILFPLLGILYWLLFYHHDLEVRKRKAL